MREVDKLTLSVNKLVNLFFELSNRYLSTVLKLKIQAGEYASPNEALRNSITLSLLSVAGCVLLILQQSGITPLMTGVKGYILTLFLATYSLLIASPLLYLLYLYSKALERGKKVEDDLKYFIIAESIIASGNPNMLDDLLCLRGKSYLFPALAKESEILSKVRKLLTAPDAVRVYCKWLKSRSVSVILSDYLFAQSLGMIKAWLREKGREFLDNLRTDSINRIKLRATVSVLFAVILGYIPPIVLAMSSLMGYGIIMKTLPLTFAIAPLFFIITPKLPRHFSMNHTGKALTTKLAGVILIVIFILLGTNTFRLPQTSGLTLKLTQYVIGLSLIILSVPSLTNILRAFREANELTKLILTIAEAPLEISSSLTIIKESLKRLRLTKLGSIIRALGTDKSEEVYKDMRLWITGFTAFIISKALSYGVLNKENLMKLRDLMLEMLREIKLSVMTNAVIAALAVSLPIILNYICIIEGGITPTIRLYIMASVITYSVYSSYIMFGDPLVTLFTGISLTELAMMGIW